MIHANISAAESRSDTTSMPRVGEWLNIPLPVVDENLTERASYHNDIVRFMQVYKKKLRAEQVLKYG